MSNLFLCSDSIFTFYKLGHSFLSQGLTGVQFLCQVTLSYSINTTSVFFFIRNSCLLTALVPLGTTFQSQVFCTLRELRTLLLSKNLLILHGYIFQGRHAGWNMGCHSIIVYTFYCECSF